MTVAVQEQEEQMTEFGSDKLQVNPSDYGCQILQEKTTLEAANDKSLPNDAYLITYIVNGETHMDLTRCKSQVSLFDMYYDTYGAGAVQSISYGYGTSNPKLWGNSKKTETKKRK